MSTTALDKPKPKRNRRTRNGSLKKRSVYGELCRVAAAQGINVELPNVSTADILQEVLDRATAHLRFAASKVDELDPEPEPNLAGGLDKMRALAQEHEVDFEPEDDGVTIRRKIRATLPDPMWERRYGPEGEYLGEEPSKWYKLEAAARVEVTNLAGMMEKLGLAERMVRVEEARAALIVRAVAEAAREAGVPRDQMRKMGAIIRDKLEEGAT